ncbi:MAG: hypothetical protein LGB68_00985 [Sulfurovum sp.]|nr:hypothetical protein [Sulfurovum sp.]
MLFPSKFTSFEESVISKMILILEAENKSMGVVDLYNKLKNKFISIDEFIFALDGLYALGYIEIEEEVIKYVN